ncbi:hypothetical protein ACSBR1_029075 [Camellia fascicularis]
MQLQCLLNQLRVQDVKHILREANGCAGLLAKKGNKLNQGPHIYTTMPSFIIEKLCKDAMGTSYPDLYLTVLSYL